MARRLPNIDGVLIAGHDGTAQQIVNVNSLGEVATTPGTTANAVTVTDRSSTIAAGGTQQTFAAASTTRRGYRVQNLSSGKLFVNDKGSSAVATETGSSFTILPGQIYESPVSGVSTAAISIIGATTGQAFEGATW